VLNSTQCVVFKSVCDQIDYMNCIGFYLAGNSDPHELYLFGFTSIVFH